ncbi:WecB/TagA/CpsF family glycosyltransferase [Spirosoma taeanense]|uniref:WecB/TagA/CpsF family glycosyltransferase n=1 Tax=Spirosoma taeanense TaxID=2735870 RepID=A0A6M5Y485_9BACT|nr:WecB/TagA/CpsF family glycosyltransferase [Spirosoma taeanense]QJW88001.1 WecB/TagA/CpsF family glycosyltransferase [Spirosoma taeanense]
MISGATPKTQSGLPTTSVIGYPVFSGKLEQVPIGNNTILINTMSPNSYGLAQKDAFLDEALKNSDVLTLDGMGVAMGSIILNGKNIKKIAGADTFDYFTSYFNQKGGRCFFVGSTEQTLRKIVNRLAIDYPDLEADYYSPPYKETLDWEDSLPIIEKINAFRPDVVFVGMSAPKQEKWAYQYKAHLDTKVIATIGNVFDWYAGNSKRPAKIWIKLRLEWFVRIFLRPEIFKRNTKNQLVFFKDVLFCLIKLKHV